VSRSADKYKTLSFISEEMELHNRGQNLEVNKLSSYQNSCFGCITHLFEEFEIKKNERTIVIVSLYLV
jgi:hypothetical protein